MRSALAVVLVLVAGGAAWWLRAQTRERSEAERRHSERPSATTPRSIEELASDARDAMTRLKLARAPAVPQLVVEVEDKHGKPRAGVAFALRYRRGDMAMAKGRTDAAGRVRLEKSPRPRALGVFADAGDGFPEVIVGHWRPGELREEPMRVVLTAPVELHVHVTVDGVPDVPKRLRIHEPPILEKNRDRTTGTLRALCRPGSSFRRIEALAPDLVQTEKSLLLRTDDGTRHAWLDFSRPVNVSIRIHGEPEFAHHIKLQRAARRGGWSTPNGSTDYSWEDDDLVVISHLVPPGRYRLITSPGSIVLREFELAATTPKTTIDLDLTRASWASPRVIGPHDGGGEQLGFTLGEHGRPVRLNRKVLHPGDRTITFCATGRLLGPDPRNGRVTTDRGGSFELHAIEAPLVRFAWPKEDRPGDLVVMLCRDGSIIGRPRVCSWWDEDCVFTAPPPGEYDLVIFPPVGAPAIARKIAISGATVLRNKFAPSPGCTLTVRPIKLAPGVVPRFSVRLADPDVPLPSGAPQLSDGILEWSSPAVPRGKIRIEVARGAHTWSRVVQSDGKTDRTVEIDCSE